MPASAEYLPAPIHPTKETSLHNKIVLVVEDDDSVQALLEDSLSDLGLKVLATTYLDVAMSLIPDADLVITDLKLSRDGGEGKVIYSRALEANIPVFIMTASIGQGIESIPGLTNAKKGTVIAKPFDLEKFLSRVQEVLTQDES